MPDLENWQAASPSRAPQKPWSPMWIVICAGLGAAAGSILLLIPVSFVSLSIIGVGVRHVGIAGIVGGLIGAFLGGLLGFRLCQD